MQNRVIMWSLSCVAVVFVSFHCLASGLDLNIAVDNELELYFDGVSNAINKDASAKDYASVKTVPVPANARVLAVHGTDTGGGAGLWASVTGDALLSDASWKMSEVLRNGWEQPNYDDSSWDNAIDHGGLNDRYKPLISANARRIWGKVADNLPYGVRTDVYFRVHLNPCAFRPPCLNGGQCNRRGNDDFTCSCLPPYTGTTCAEKDMCLTKPCKNGGVCTKVDSATGFTCSCPFRYIGPTCADSKPYQLNITVDDDVAELYFDGALYTDDLPNRSIFNIKDQVDLPKIPNVIAVLGENRGGVYGVLAEDSLGHFTDSSWKCTDVYYDDWMSPDYDDSAWPAAVVKSVNGQRRRPCKEINLTANYIWSPAYNSITNSAYCRLHIA
jgi:hypothetical protein